MERLHRRLLDVIKDEFDRRGRDDMNSVQALLLYNIGDKELTASELRTRGYYLGSNVSYNLKKLVELGFLDHQRSRIDRRSVRIRLTAQGQEIRKIVDALYQKHIKTVEQVGGISNEEFAMLNKSLHRLERFWTDQNSIPPLKSISKAALRWRPLAQKPSSKRPARHIAQAFVIRCYMLATGKHLIGGFSNFADGLKPGKFHCIANARWDAHHLDQGVVRKIRTEVKHKVPLRRSAGGCGCLMG